MADKVADSSAFNLIYTTSNERMSVSTVSIVGGRAPGSMAVVWACTY